MPPDSRALVRRSDVDQTQPSIDVWVCPVCGYWRQGKTTGVHMTHEGFGPAKRHQLVKARYVFEGEVVDA